MHTSVQFWAGARWKKADITQRRVGTSQDQQSPRCYSWLFPGWDLQPWVTCPAETHRDGESEVRGVQRTRLLSDILHICVHWSAASSWKADQLHRVQQQDSLPQHYLEDFCLARVGVCVLFPSLLGVMLILPLGPDLTGATLELGSTLTAFTGHIWKHIYLFVKTFLTDPLMHKVFRIE